MGKQSSKRRKKRLAKLDVQPSGDKTEPGSMYRLKNDYKIYQSWDVHFHDEGDSPDEDMTYVDVCNFFGHLLEVISQRGLTADLLEFDKDNPQRDGEAWIIAYLHFMGLQDLHKQYHCAVDLIEDLKDKEARGKLVVYEE